MFLHRLCVINLFIFINCILSIPDQSFYYRKPIDYFSLRNKNTYNILNSNEQTRFTWFDIMFILILILIFLILLICIYYQQLIANFIFNLFSKRKNHKIKNNERVCITNEILSLKNIQTMYLTIPQPLRGHH